MKTKIIIAGIGGVGGYFGGVLAKYFYWDESVRVCFLARGAHLDAIRSNGLRVIKGSNEFMARPAAVSDQAHSFLQLQWLPLISINASAGFSKISRSLR